MSGANGWPPRARGPYEVLGISHGAAPEEIASAYRGLLRRLHPDTGAQPADPARLADVLAAYAVLRDPVRRAMYDRQHPSSAPPPSAASAPVRISVRVRSGALPRRPDIWAGPVRRHHPS